MPEMLELTLLQRSGTFKLPLVLKLSCVQMSTSGSLLLSPPHPVAAVVPAAMRPARRAVLNEAIRIIALRRLGVPSAMSGGTRKRYRLGSSARVTSVNGAQYCGL